MQPLDPAGHGDARAELLGLDLRAGGERLAGDAGGEAEIVLDPGAGAGLTARCLLLEHHGVESLGGGVHGGGQPGGPCPDHDHVGNSARVECLGDTQGGAQLGVGRAHQRHAGPAEHDGGLRGVESAFGQQRGAVARRPVVRSVGGRFGVHGQERMAVAGQEPLDPQPLAVATDADHGYCGLSVRDEPGAAQDERAHDDLGDVGLGGQHAAELRLVEPCNPAVDSHASADEDRAVVEQVQLAGELVLGVDGHHVRSVGPGLVDLNEPAEHEEEVDTAVVDLEERRPGRQFLDRAERRDPFDLVLGQAREGLGHAGVGSEGPDAVGSTVSGSTSALPAGCGVGGDVASSGPPATTAQPPRLSRTLTTTTPPCGPAANRARVRRSADVLRHRCGTSTLPTCGRWETGRQSSRSRLTTCFSCRRMIVSLPRQSSTQPSSRCTSSSSRFSRTRRSPSSSRYTRW